MSDFPASLRTVVGRCGVEALGTRGALVDIAKACRKAGGWFVWSTEGYIVKPVKTVAATESGTGKAEYEDQRFARVHLKGRHRDGRAFVVRYVEGKPDVAYVLSHEHEVTLEDGSPHRWTTEAPSLERVTATKVKGYVK